MLTRDAPCLNLELHFVGMLHGSSPPEESIKRSLLSRRLFLDCGSKRASARVQFSQKDATVSMIVAPWRLIKSKNANGFVLCSGVVMTTVAPIDRGTSNCLKDDVNAIDAVWR